MSPPSNWAKARLSASPRPVPPNLRVVVSSAWVKRWNRRPTCSGVMPMPVSRTANASQSPSGARLALDPQGDGAALGELGGVLEQVEQALAQLHRVGAAWPGVGGDVEHQVVALLADQGLDGAGRVRDEGGDVDVLGDRAPSSRPRP